MFRRRLIIILLLVFLTCVDGDTPYQKKKKEAEKKAYENIGLFLDIDKIYKINYYTNKENIFFLVYTKRKHFILFRQNVLNIKEFEMFTIELTEERDEKNNIKFHKNP